jgi:predicted nucleotide-binding protein (sugar kinase/HSP70/actin superfamily)
MFLFLAYMGNTIQDIVFCNENLCFIREVYELKIGIPRALLYSIYLPLWKTFLEELGHK